MKTIGVGVTTARGKVVVPRAHNLPRRLELYDFELRSIASAYHRGETLSVADLASVLSRLGLTADGKPLPPAALGSALTRTVAAASRKPRAASSFVPLLLRQLGLLHAKPYDLARTVRPTSLTFDPFQETLVLLDFAAAAAQRASPPVGAAPRGARGRATVASAKPCESSFAELGKQVSPLGKWFASNLPLLKGVNDNVLKPALITEDLIHGVMLAFSVAVDSSGIALHTHLGPAGHDTDAGKPVDFALRVVMRDDYGAFVVNCGALAGMQFPKPGPIPDVPISWNVVFPGDRSPEDWGTVTDSNPGGKTDSGGHAAAHFVPEDEVVVGQSAVTHVAGRYLGKALYQSAFKNVPGTIAQFLFPKAAIFDWEVAYHLPPQHLKVAISGVKTQSAVGPLPAAGNWSVKFEADRTPDNPGCPDATCFPAFAEVEYEAPYIDVLGYHQDIGPDEYGCLGHVDFAGTVHTSGGRGDVGEMTVSLSTDMHGGYSYRFAGAFLAPVTFPPLGYQWMGGPGPPFDCGAAEGGTLAIVGDDLNDNGSYDSLPIVNAGTAMHPLTYTIEASQ